LPHFLDKQFSKPTKKPRRPTTTKPGKTPPPQVRSYCGLSYNQMVEATQILMPISADALRNDYTLQDYSLHTPSRDATLVKAWCLNLDGVDQQLRANTSVLDLASVTTTLRAVARVKFDAGGLGSSQAIVSKYRTTGGGQRNWMIWKSASDALYVHVSDDGQSATSTNTDRAHTTTWTASADVWYKIDVTYDITATAGSRWTVLIDDVEVALTQDFSAAITSINEEVPYTLRQMRVGSQVDNTLFFDGQVAGVEVYVNGTQIVNLPLAGNLDYTNTVGTNFVTEGGTAAYTSSQTCDNYHYNFYQNLNRFGATVESKRRFDGGDNSQQWAIDAGVDDVEWGFGDALPSGYSQGQPDGQCTYGGVFADVCGLTLSEYNEAIQILLPAGEDALASDGYTVLDYSRYDPPRNATLVKAQCIHVDGSNSIRPTSAEVDYSSLTQSLDIEAYVYFDTVAGSVTEAIAAKWRTTGTNQRNWRFLRTAGSGGKLLASVNQTGETESSSNTNQVTGSTVLADSTWYKVRARYTFGSPGYWELWVNDVPETLTVNFDFNVTQIHDETPYTARQERIGSAIGVWELDGNIAGFRLWADSTLYFDVPFLGSATNLAPASSHPLTIDGNAVTYPLTCDIYHRNFYDAGNRFSSGVESKLRFDGGNPSAQWAIDAGVDNVEWGWGEALPTDYGQGNANGECTVGGAGVETPPPVPYTLNYWRRTSASVGWGLKDLHDALGGQVTAADISNAEFLLTEECQKMELRVSEETGYNDLAVHVGGAGNLPPIIAHFREDIMFFRKSFQNTPFTDANLPVGWKGPTWKFPNVTAVDGNFYCDPAWRSDCWRQEPDCIPDPSLGPGANSNQVKYVRDVMEETGWTFPNNTDLPDGPEVSEDPWTGVTEPYELLINQMGKNITWWSHRMKLNNTGWQQAIVDYVDDYLTAYSFDGMLVSFGKRQYYTNKSPDDRPTGEATTSASGKNRHLLEWVRLADSDLYGETAAPIASQCFDAGVTPTWNVVTNTPNVGDGQGGGTWISAPSEGFLDWWDGHCGIWDKARSLMTTRGKFCVLDLYGHGVTIWARTKQLIDAIKDARYSGDGDATNAAAEFYNKIKSMCAEADWTYIYLYDPDLDDTGVYAPPANFWEDIEASTTVLDPRWLGQYASN
jgi:hypothetical protein